MPVGLSMHVDEIGLATHLRYKRPCTRTYGQTELQPEPVRGGASAPITHLSYHTLKNFAMINQGLMKLTRVNVKE